LLRFGPEEGPVVALFLPLFEEANRTRAFGVSLLRALARRGIGGVLPDLPGQGESEIATAAATLADLRKAGVTVGATHVIAIRSGALLAPDRPAWLLSPQTGRELVRELTRVSGAPLDGDLVEVAGNLLSRVLLNDLQGATHVAGRVVRLTSDPQPADLHVDGSPLWRRAEPDNDPALVQLLAADIESWLATCAG